MATASTPVTFVPIPTATALDAFADELRPIATAFRPFAPICAPLPIAMPLEAAASTNAALAAPLAEAPPMATELAALACAFCPVAMLY